MAKEERKYPRLGKAALKKELVKRTGFTPKFIEAVLLAYNETLREALACGFEYNITGIGLLTFQEQKPRPAGEYWNGSEKKRMYFPDRPGYYKLWIKPDDKFKRYLRSSTYFGKVGDADEYNAWVMEHHPDKPIFAREDLHNRQDDDE